LGFNYGELGKSKESMKYYEQLVASYPSSVFAGEAHREMAEFAFQKGDFRKAASSFEAGLRKASADARPRLLHKLAWTYYRTRQFDRAVQTMKDAINEAGKSGEKFLGLRDEGLRDLAIFMTESGKVEEAVAYFQNVAGDKTFYPKALERLGKQYERNVEPVKATQVYESLLRTNPDSEAAFRVLVKLVDLDLRRKRHMEALKRLDDLKLPKGGDTETQLSAQNLRAMIRRTATEHHEEYRKKKDKAALNIAERYYEAYLAVFLAKDDPRGETPEIRMYLAEVKRDLGKSKEASMLYRQVIDSRDKRYAKEAGALWTASLAEAIKAQASGAKAPNTKSGDASALQPSAMEMEFVDASDQLQDALGDTNEGREAALRAAQVLAGYKKTRSDAIDRARKIMKRSSKSAQAITAARLWLQLEADRGAEGVDDLKDAIEEIRENAALLAADQESGSKLASYLQEQETQFRIGAIAKSEKDKDYKTAAKGYESLAADTKDRELAEKAYLNAMGAYMREGDAEGALRVVDAWLKRYPKTPKATDQLRIAATNFLIRGRFELSASVFERLGRETGEMDAIETAARIQDGNGDSASAQRNWAGYLTQFPRSPHRARVTLALASSYIATGRDGDAAKLYRECMNQFKELEAECGLKLADLYLKNRDQGNAEELWKRIGAPKKKGLVSPYVGYARFLLAERMETGAKFEPLRLPEANLKKGLKQRLDFLEPLSRSYNSVVDAGGPWAVAALERLGQWAYGFAEELDRIEPPAGADEKRTADFRKSLAAISGPLKQKAIATWKDAYAKAVAAEALSPAVPRLVDRLADTQQGARAQGFRGKLRLAGLAADGGSDGASNAFEKMRDRLFKNAQDANAWVDYGNLLWGQGKPQLARLAYERSISLNPKNPASLNNRAVVLLSGDGQDDWVIVAEASELLLKALDQDGFFVPAKINRAALLNYYRLFPKAKPLWEQVLAKGSFADGEDGFAVALLGTGNANAADAAWARAVDNGAPKARFVALFHQAARAAASGASGASKCLSLLEDLTKSSAGFEAQSVERLKERCKQLKEAR
jgi:outer membrane protein assembly factor BamD (BamD/ComL family)